MAVDTTQAPSWLEASGYPLTDCNHPVARSTSLRNADGMLRFCSFTGPVSGVGRQHPVQQSSRAVRTSPLKNRIRSADSTAEIT